MKPRKFISATEQAIARDADHGVGDIFAIALPRRGGPTKPTPTTLAALHGIRGGGGGEVTGPPGHKETPPRNNTQLAYSVDAAARMVGISRALLYRLWSLNAGPEIVRLSSGRVLIRKEALEKWLVESTVPSKKARLP